MDQSVITTKEACKRLGMPWRMFDTWRKRLDLDGGAEHPLDKRLRMVPIATVEAIAAAREEMRSVLATSVESPLSAPQRHAPKTTSERTPLPGGWITYNKWLERHNIFRRAAEQEILAGKMVAPSHGLWWSPPNEIKSAYSREAHKEASDYARRRWPDRFVACPQCDDSAARTASSSSPQE